MALWAASSSSILLHLHAFFVLLTLLLLAAMASTTAAASVPVDDHPDENTTTTFTNGSTTTTTTSSPNNGGENFEMYYCFLCTERHPLLIHYCPIYWDECHLNCWDFTPSTAAIIPEAATTAPPSQGSSSGSGPHHPMDDSTVQGKECYVMKLYKSGSYVIVERLSCDGIASCFLTCGGGELAADRKVAAAMGATAAATTVPAAMMQGSFVPFELCNTELVN